MDFKEILQIRRTVRLFRQCPVDKTVLLELVNAARLASCAVNKQHLRYIIVRTPEVVNKILEYTAWAALVAPHRTPAAGESAPAAFIVMTTTESVPSNHAYADAGAAMQSLEFAAANAGLGCCWLGSADRQKIGQLLECSGILYLAAVGYPAEAPAYTDIPAAADTAYYLDEDGRLTVPKIQLADLVRFV